MDVLYVGALAVIFWLVVFGEILPALRDRNRDEVRIAESEALLPTSDEVAAAEAELPEVRDGWHLPGVPR